MAKKSAADKNRAKLLAAMTPLHLLPSFQDFIKQVVEMKDFTVQSMVHTDTVVNERESMALVGEVRAYLWIIEAHRSQKEQLEQQTLAAEQQRAQQ